MNIFQIVAPFFKQLVAGCFVYLYLGAYDDLNLIQRSLFKYLELKKNLVIYFSVSNLVDFIEKNFMAYLDFLKIFL